MKTRLPILLTGYGLPYTCGYIPLRDGSANPSPWTPVDLAVAADRLGLCGVEVPLSTRVPSFDGREVSMPSYVEAFGETLRERALASVVDFGVVATQSPEDLAGCLRDAHRVGARVVRAIISDVLCGDRRVVAEGWKERLEATAARLRQVAPLALDLGICLAIENHQDATTEDLWWLHEHAGGGDAVGVTLDTGNPLAVAQDPLEACRALAPIIRHVHLKDYRLHRVPQGYRLVRCAAGEGMVDFPSILQVLHESGSHASLGIEQAAQSGRTIPLLDAGWWSTFPNRSAPELLPVLELIWSHARPLDEDDRSPWEAGADAASVLDDEWQTLVRGVDYFAALVRNQ